jgi:hypothetical protein
VLDEDDVGSLPPARAPRGRVAIMTIRDGKRIDLWLPSGRMREIFRNWLGWDSAARGQVCESGRFENS